MNAATADAGLCGRLEEALARSDGPGAIALAEEAVATRPGDAEAYRHLAQLLAAAGDRLRAQRAAMRACELAPNDPRAWSDLGRVHAAFGEYAHAARCFAEAVEIDAAHADAWHNLGTAWRQLGQAQPAFDAFKRCLQAAPQRAETWLALGSLLAETGQFDDAVECLERAARSDPSLARARSRLAEHWSRAGKVRRADALFRQSLGLDPQHLQGWFGLGRTLEDLGDAEGALDCYRHAATLKPDYAPALGHYLALVRGAPDAALLERAQALADDAQASDDARAMVGYGLAKHHDVRGDHAAAAAAGLAANAARRRSAGALDRAGLARRVDDLVATCNADFFRERRGFGVGSDQLVFIVGLPRSGTTLVEQILSAHPRLHGAGELPDLARLAESCVDTGVDELWQAACRLDRARSRALAGDYLRALRDGAPRGRLRISDKSPLNFFQLAFAALLFPGARVIHCTRDARDTALSIWMENFNADQRYATDFDDLAFFTTQYRRLMAHWQAHLPLPLLELRYEDTVADIEAQARRLLAFLEVPWDARCLDFHRSERAVQTPSRWQVRRPLYTRSVGRWRAYAPLLPALEQAFAQLP